MGGDETKVVGFVAQRVGSVDLLCQGDSAVVAGSDSKMTAYIASIPGRAAVDYDIRKARYGHILKCLRLGAAYSFDEESYGRFRPLAMQEGNRLAEFGSDANVATGKTGLHLMRVKLV